MVNIMIKHFVKRATKMGLRGPFFFCVKNFGEVLMVFTETRFSLFDGVIEL
jgi:hypothetical protein